MHASVLAHISRIYNVSLRVLFVYCDLQGWQYEIISHLRSGINYNKRGLTKLVKLLLTGEVRRLIVTHKDRLLRFGSELIFSLCEQLNVEVIIINHDVNATPEQELVQDVLEVITVFSARLYGRLMPSE